MDFENRQLVNRVLKEYYEKNLSQKEIAYTEHISKSTVSRIIAKAKEDGRVQIRLNLEYESMEEMEERIRRAFSLEAVRICPEILPDRTVRLRDVARRLGEDLQQSIRKNDILALGWGTTLGALAELMPYAETARSGVRIVQACGSISGDWNSLSTYRMMRIFAEKLQATPQLFPAPILMSSAELAEALRKDPQIAEALLLAEQAQICIFTAGIMESKSVLLRNRSLQYEVFADLVARGAVGDILFHFLDRNGEPVDPDLDARTMSLSIENLRRKETRILIAVGEHRTESILGALRAGLANRFYTDERTARHLLASPR